MFKDFNFRPAPAADGDQPEGFRVHVFDADGEEVAVEEFRIVDFAPLNAYANLGTALASGIVAGNTGVDRFIRSMLVPEDQAAWSLLIADQSKRIDAAEVAPIVRWLVEVLSARPTSRPSGSPAGPSSNGASSTATAPPAAPTPEP